MGTLVINTSRINKTLKNKMLSGFGSSHPLIDSVVVDGRVLSHSCCLVTPIIAIAVSCETSCAHVMYVVCTPRVVRTEINFLVSIISWSLYCCYCGDKITLRFRYP